ncbi:hypothetical protein CONLIGDRAFT_676178 [Coniochaeta ligniaria NRRL 30616]|uniref:F-box domain-containing protein n=1 Tax=Coniochaeta ligniaria NRRL 30616 TaxID=1408157 RepID=A0A1J7K0L3_9PEZI|nr:hypothetical protein CONLIGDRAFT_676178 [Coniochaeta ligniaria NRRL 30616]
MSEHSEPATKPLPSLPGDCWVLILSQLPAREVIRARRISKQWRAVFTDSGICRHLLYLLFPQSREVRLDMLRHRIDDLPHMPHNLRVEVECRAKEEEDWVKTIVTVARRYHHLQGGTPREYLKLPMPDMVDYTTPDDCSCRLGDVCADCRFKIAQGRQFFWMAAPVLPRAFRSSREYHLPDPMWWYSQEDALLVYPTSWRLDDKATPPINWTEMELESKSKDDTFLHCFSPPKKSCKGFFYRLFDPETGEHMSVPFDIRGRIIRRVRLAQGVLVLEWIQIHPDKTAIDGAKVKKNKMYKTWAKEYGHPWFEYLVRNTHMVTVFDVVRTPVNADVEYRQRRRWTWEVRLRHEWKLPAWGSGPPKVQLYYDYRPRFFSAHTATHYALLIWTQKRRRGHDDTARQLYVWDISHVDQGGKKAKGPTLVRRLLEEDMRHHQDIIAEQQSRITLRNIAMDEHNVYLIHDDHREASEANWVNRRSPVRTHIVFLYGIPVIPFPPACQGPVGPSSDTRNQVTKPVFGPHWVDLCPSGDPGFVVEEEDDSDDVFCRHIIRGNELALRRSSPVIAPGPYSSLPETLLPPTRNLSYPWNESDAACNPLQPRNFPGFVPCWRHENYPYIGISAVTDYAAGVRWTARDIHGLPPMPPAVAVNISGASRLDDNANGHSIRSDEVDVKFPGFWKNMMGRMTLAGDERWLIGQDSENKITLVRF